MNDARVGPLLAQESLASYRPLGAFGRPVYESYLQIRGVLGTRLGSRYANYFARPNLDQSAGTVRWTADVDGPVRHWSEMPPEEQTRRALELETIRAGLEAYVRELRVAPEPAAGQKGESPRAFASLLEQAVVIPSARHLHFVGDQPVATFWGFQELSGDGLNALALRPPPRPAVPPSIGATAPSAGIAEGRFPWWLLWLLFGLLAILFLLFAWWRCWLPLPCPAPTGFSIGDIFSGKQQPDTPLPDDSGVVVVPGGTVQGDGTFVPGGTTTTPSDGSTPATDANGQLPPGDQSKTPEDPNKPKDASQQPKTENQPPQDQQKPPENDASKDAPKDKNAQTNPPKPLDIPPDAAAKGDVGFMDGQWRSGAGLVDQADGKPLDQYYRFDKNGKGEVVVKRANGTECKAPAQATFNGKNLTVEETSDVRCADGRTYGKSTTTCTRDAKGNTVCKGKNPDGTTYAVPVQKMP
jgi:hypothetical protein